MALEDRKQPQGTGDHPPSPCVSICDVDWAEGVCLGCGRTLDEIGAWPSATAEEKRAILRRLEDEAGAGPA